MDAKDRMKEQLTVDPATPLAERRKGSQKQGFFRNILSKFYPTKSDSNTSAQALETFKFDSLDFNTSKGKKMLYTIARRYPLIFRSLQIKSSFAIPSIDFEFNTPAEEKVVEAFLKELHPASGEKQLKVLLADLYLDTTAFGTGFLDPIWNKKKTMITGFRKIHPISMDLRRQDGFGTGGEVTTDTNGNPLGWTQVTGEGEDKTKELAFNSVAFLTFNTFGDEWLGISDLEPLYQTTWRLMNIEEGIATAIFRHGFPLYDVTVSGGVDGRPPTKEQLENAAKEVTGLNYKSEFIHPPNYKVQLLESFSMGATKDYVDPFIDQIAALSGVPRFILLGKAVDVAKSSFPELISTIELNLKPSQDKLKLFFEEQVLCPLMKANHIDTVPQLVIGRTDLFINAEKEKIKKEQKKKDEDERAGLELRNLKEAKPNKEAIRQANVRVETKKKMKEKTLTAIDKTNNKIIINKSSLSLPGKQASELISEERKQLILSVKEKEKIKSKVGKEIELMEDGAVVGVIKLREPRQININDFTHLEYAHLISSQDRMNIWGNETEFYTYEFDIIRGSEIQNAI